MKPTWQEVMAMVVKKPPIKQYKDYRVKGIRRKFVWGMNWNTMQNYPNPDLKKLAQKINKQFPEAEAKEFQSSSRTVWQLAFYSRN